jgi:hypothetical protein
LVPGTASTIRSLLLSSKLHLFTDERGISMTDSKRFLKIEVLFLGMLLAASGCWAQKCSPTAEKIAKAYGLDSFGQIDAIRYTFSVDVPGLKASRTWIWEPKADRVTFDGKDKEGKPVKATYIRSQIDSQPDNVKKEIDPSFINDNYWLLFPFHACWDGSADVQDKGMQKLPIGKGSARQVVVKYPSQGGYTPGDAWELFVGADNLVQQFIYRGGSANPRVVTATWAGYKKAGPLVVATDHRGNAGGKPLRLIFSDVAVKLTGSDKWVDAH